MSTMHPRLGELLADADHVRDELLAFVADLTPQQLQVAGPEGGWSVAQHLAHLHLVEQSSVRAMFRALRDARAAGLERESETSSLLGVLAHTGLAQATTKRVAPDFVTPVDSPDVQTARARLSESRGGLRAWGAEADGWALTTVYFPHPALGRLNLYEWVAMIADHERRHLAHMRRVVAASASQRGSA